jgi:hypothetical protein
LGPPHPSWLQLTRATAALKANDVGQRKAKEELAALRATHARLTEELGQKSKEADE